MQAEAQMLLSSLAIITVLLPAASYVPCDGNEVTRAGLTPDGISGLVIGIIGILIAAISVWIGIHRVRAATL